MKTARRTWRLSICCLLIALTGSVGVIAAGDWLTRPALREIGEPPSPLRAEHIGIPYADSRLIKGWFIPGEAGRGAVLLLHGVRSNRLQMLPRARFLHAAGYSTLLIDLPAHGESSAERITFGRGEARGVEVALDYLQRRLAGERLAVIGVSLGAASLVFAERRPRLHAVVLESLYPSIDDAVKNRLSIKLGDAGKVLAPLLLWQLPLRLGIDTSELRPIAHIAQLNAPLLLVAGQQDRHTTWRETERLFAAAAAPKELWGVANSAHVDLHRAIPRAYEKKILAFLSATMH